MKPPTVAVSLNYSGSVELECSVLSNEFWVFLFFFFKAWLGLYLDNWGVH